MTPRRSISSWLAALIRNLLASRRRDTELRADVDTYVEMLIDEKIAAGLAPAEARRRVLMELGSVDAIKEGTRAVRAGAMLAEIGNDVRYAFRMMRRDSSFSVVAILTLALGIGANTAIFSLIRTVVLRPLPYGQPDKLFVIWDRTRSPTAENTHLSASELKGYGQSADVAIAGYLESNGNLIGGGEPERVRMARVTANLFDVLRVAPLHGRTFTAADVADDRRLVIGYGLWLRRFGGSVDIIGRDTDFNGEKLTIVGVMPAGFQLPLDYRSDRPTEIWRPINLDDPSLSGWGNRSFFGVGRVRPAVSMQVATTQLHAASDEWVRAGLLHDMEGRLRAREARTVRELLLGEVRHPLLMLQATVAVVLLIAVANVINLLAARADTRRQEVAIRIALGAGRRRLVRQVFVESLTVSAFGALFGIALAWAALHVLVLFKPANLPRIGEAGIDPAVLTFTAALALLTAGLFGLAPAVRFSKADLTPTLRDGGRGGTQSPARRLIRAGLVAAQLAMSVVLLLSAALLTRTLIALTRVDPGFDTHDVLTAQIALPVATYPQPDHVVSFYQRVIDRLEQVPGVTAAGAIRIIPLTRPIGDWSITIEGQVRNPGDNPNGHFQWATPGYFKVLGLRMLEGRPLADTDRVRTMPVVVINDTMARRYWPGENAIGKRFKMGTGDMPYMTIVGIVAPSRHDALVEGARAEMYLAHAQLPVTVGGATRAMALVMKTERDPLAFVDALKSTVHGVDPNLPVSDIQTMEQVTGKVLSQPRFTASLLMVFAMLALTLAGVGIYGTVSLLVSERSPEIGIRMALGASRGSILSMVLRQSAIMAAAGIAAGLGAGFLVAPLLMKMLYGVEPLDPATFAAVPILLMVIALAGSLAPARRASRVDPMVTLKR